MPVNQTSAPLSAYTQVGKSIAIAGKALKDKQEVYRKNGVKIAGEGERLSRSRKVLNAFIKFRLSFTSQKLRDSRKALNQARTALVAANEHVGQGRLPFELFLKVMDDSKPQESVLDQVHNAAQAAATISWTDFAQGVENFVFDLVSGDNFDSKDVSASPKPVSNLTKKRDTLRKLMEGKPVTLKELEEFREYLPVMAALQERERLLKGAEENLLAKSKDKEARLGDKIQALAALVQQMNHTKIDVQPYGEINLTTFAAQYEALSPKTQKCIKSLLTEVHGSEAYKALKEFGKERPDLEDKDAVEALLTDENKQKDIKEFLDLYQKHGETIAGLAQDLPDLTQMSKDAKIRQILARENELKPLTELRGLCGKAKKLQEWKGQWDKLSTTYRKEMEALGKQGEETEAKLSTLRSSCETAKQQLKEANAKVIAHQEGYLKDQSVQKSIQGSGKRQAEIGKRLDQNPVNQKLLDRAKKAKVEGRGGELKAVRSEAVEMQRGLNQVAEFGANLPKDKVTALWTAADEAYLQTLDLDKQLTQKEAVIEARKSVQSKDFVDQASNFFTSFTSSVSGQSTVLEDWDREVKEQVEGELRTAFPGVKQETIDSFVQKPIDQQKKTLEKAYTIKGRNQASKTAIQNYQRILLNREKIQRDGVRSNTALKHELETMNKIRWYADLIELTKCLEQGSLRAEKAAPNAKELKKESDSYLSAKKTSEEKKKEYEQLQQQVDQQSAKLEELSERYLALEQLFG
jgi:hypothetical protein